jgi:hypothetical protein
MQSKVPPNIMVSNADTTALDHDQITTAGMAANAT